MWWRCGQVVLFGLLELCNDPCFGVELYVHYDCEVASMDLLQRLCGALARNAVAHDDIQGSCAPLSHQVLTTLCRRLAEAGRCAAGLPSEELAAALALGASCRAAREKKRRLLVGVSPSFP